MIKRVVGSKRNSLGESENKRFLQGFWNQERKIQDGHIN
jgi:hypothetical protein